MSNQAYKNYIRKIVTRVNTITGVAYSNDPTVFAWELANEPHCNDGYEDRLGVPRASIVRTWVAEIAAYIKSLDSNHMVGSRSFCCVCASTGAVIVMWDGRPSISCRGERSACMPACMQKRLVVCLSCLVHHAWGWEGWQLPGICLLRPAFYTNVLPGLGDLLLEFRLVAQILFRMPNIISIPEIKTHQLSSFGRRLPLERRVTAAPGDQTQGGAMMAPRVWILGQICRTPTSTLAPSMSVRTSHPAPSYQSPNQAPAAAHDAYCEHSLLHCPSVLRERCISL